MCASLDTLPEEDDSKVSCLSQIVFQTRPQKNNSAVDLCRHAQDAVRKSGLASTARPFAINDGLACLKQSIEETFSE